MGARDACEDARGRLWGARLQPGGCRATMGAPRESVWTISNVNERWVALEAATSWVAGGSCRNPFAVGAWGRGAALENCASVCERRAARGSWAQMASAGGSGSRAAAPAGPMSGFAQQPNSVPVWHGMLPLSWVGWFCSNGPSRNAVKRCRLERQPGSLPPPSALAVAPETC